MNCPKCGDILFEAPYTFDYRDKDTIMITEHYKCYECLKVYARHATYEMTKEEWEDIV